MKHNPLEFKILRFFEAVVLPALGEPGRLVLVLQVSGGKDSVAMLKVFHSIANSPLRKSQTEIELVVQHFDHKRRGEASSGDAQFVKELAQSLSVTFVMEEAQGQTFVGDNFQDAARRWRMEHGCRLRDSYLGAAGVSALVLTAHHASDHVESVLQHILRGSGVSGLTGIREFELERKIWRPFARVSQREILCYLQDTGTSFREDASNLSNAYQRNALRNRLLPILAELNPNFEEAFLRLSDNVSEVESSLADYEKNQLQGPELLLSEITTAGSLVRRATQAEPQLKNILTLNSAKNILHEVRRANFAGGPRKHAAAQLPGGVKKIPLSNGWCACLYATKLVFSKQPMENVKVQSSDHGLQPLS